MQVFDLYGYFAKQVMDRSEKEGCYSIAVLIDNMYPNYSEHVREKIYSAYIKLLVRTKSFFLLKFFEFVPILCLDNIFRRHYCINTKIQFLLHY